MDTLPRTDLVKTITACRSCGSGALDEVLDLGTHAVSDFYDTVPVDELRAPLCLVQCGSCGLVQLTHSVSRDRLYKDYWYRSGLNPAMVAALKDVVEDAMGRVSIGPNDSVLDIGANDGTLLRQLPYDIIKVACDPSETFSSDLHSVADVIIPTYWSGDAYTQGIPTHRRSEGKDSPEQREILGRDGGVTGGSDAHNGNQGTHPQEQYRPELSRLRGISPSPIGEPQRQDGQSGDTQEEKCSESPPLRDNRTNGQIDSREFRVRRLATPGVEVGNGTMCDLPEGIQETGSRPHQAIRPLPGTSIRGHERPGALPNVPPSTRLAWESRQAKAIFSVACFYDVDNPSEFVQSIKKNLHPEGVWVNQMMDLDGMLDADAFDNICHEHVAYWRTEDFRRILDRHELYVESTSRNGVNGGSIRHIVRHGRGLLSDINTTNLYRNDIGYFSHRIQRAKDQCLAFLEDCRYNGKTVLGYGASTKGNTLLQYYGIDPDLLPAIAERNPDKVGKLTAGSHIPIISEAEMRERQPDYLLVLPWHFIDGFVEREKELLAQGTRLVAPLPTFRVIGG